MEVLVVHIGQNLHHTLNQIDYGDELLMDEVIIIDWIRYLKRFSIDSDHVLVDGTSQVYENGRK